MQQIRISSTGKVRDAIDILKNSRYPLLSDAEIVKVVLSQAVMNKDAGEAFFVEELDERTSKSVSTSRQQIQKGDYQMANSAKDLLQKLEQ